MIRYTLTCDQNHSFESWFKSSAAYDALAASGNITCATCGSPNVRKTLMAPAVTTAEAGPLTSKTPTEEAIAKLRREVEENSDYVGTAFANQARAMHDGDLPERSIYGEVRIDDARALIEDGIPVSPLPFAPRRRTN